MATDSKKKSKEAGLLIPLDDSSIGFCSGCMYTWCSLKDHIVYCSLKYKGISGLHCENGYCHFE
ncbi:MAG: hypothetical protein JXA54_04090 [Candidatus Heimdallarchaeota archaeon]|nr:hypothetical protein [Candidatus Heimdallarchaeota archaeon]